MPPMVQQLRTPSNFLGRKRKDHTGLSLHPWGYSELNCNIHMSRIGCCALHFLVYHFKISDYTDFKIQAYPKEYIHIHIHKRGSVWFTLNKNKNIMDLPIYISCASFVYTLKYLNFSSQKVFQLISKIVNQILVRINKISHQSMHLQLTRYPNSKNTIQIFEKRIQIVSSKQFLF